MELVFQIAAGILLAVILYKIRGLIFALALFLFGILIVPFLPKRKIPDHVFKVMGDYEGFYQAIERTFDFQTAVAEGSFAKLLAEKFIEDGCTTGSVQIFLYDTKDFDNLGKPRDDGKVGIVPVYFTQKDPPVFRCYFVDPKYIH